MRQVQSPSVLVRQIASHREARGFALLCLQASLRGLRPKKRLVASCSYNLLVMASTEHRVLATSSFLVILLRFFDALQDPRLSQCLKAVTRYNIWFRKTSSRKHS